MPDPWDDPAQLAALMHRPDMRARLANAALGMPTGDPNALLTASMTHQPPDPVAEDIGRRTRQVGQNLWNTWTAPYRIAENLGRQTREGTLDPTNPETAGSGLELAAAIAGGRMPFAKPGELGSAGGKLVVARRLPDGTVAYGKPGEVHSSLLTKDEYWGGRIGPEVEEQMGFADPNGKFMTRQQAMDWAKKNEPKYADYVEEAHPGYGLEGSSYNRAAREIGPASEPPPSITAFHGSPHDFDKFDLSKIGTGEGAQAYGHGLYFAENEPTARYYRDVISQNQGTPVQELMSQALQGRSREDAIKGLRETADSLKGSPEPRSYTPRYTAADYAEAANRLEQGEQHGRMYQVSINADPEHFLDWDKPLSEQSEKVQKAVLDAERQRAIEDKLDIPWIMDRAKEKIEGGASVHDFVQRPEQTERLRAAGIPGIKYLDQGSRVQPQQVEHLKTQISGLEDMLAKTPKDDPRYGDIQNALAGRRNELSQMHPTRNFVVFDDKLIDIMKKYGLAGLSALPAAGMYHFQQGGNQGAQ